MAGGVGDHDPVERLDHAHVPYRRGHTLRLEQGGGCFGRLQHLAHGEDAHVPLAVPGRAGGAGAAGREARPDVLDRRLRSRGLGPADGGRAVEVQGVPQHDPHLLG